MRKGFTLIELLVVIAIIAILAAILFPVFARAREKARQTSCLSNVKQIVLSTLMYNQDYDERAPWARTQCGGDPVEAKISVVTKILPYVKNGGIFNCPSSPWDANCGGSGIPHHNIPNDKAAGRLPADLILSIGFNEDMLVWGRKMATYQYPADTVVCADASGYVNWHRIAAANVRVCDVPGGGCGGMDSGAGGMSDVHTRHNGGSNVGFLDGHAKWTQWGNARNLRFGP